MNKNNELKLEEKERRKKELWWGKHPILHFFYQIFHRLGQLPPDE